MNLHTDIQHITNKQTSMLTDDVDYTQHSSTYTLIITEVPLTLSTLITLSIDTPTEIQNTTHQQMSSPDITYVSSTLHNLEHQTLSSDPHLLLHQFQTLQT